MDCLVSVDCTRQKCGYQSLLGAVYVIECQTGKVLDYKVFCKFCQTKMQISWRGRNLMKANVNVILMVAQVL